MFRKHNTAIIAPPRGGKNNLLETIIMDNIKHGTSQTIILPHEESFKRTMNHLYGFFGEHIADFVVVDDLTRYDKAIMRPMVFFSTAENPFQREAEDAAYRERFFEQIISRIGKEKWEEGLARQENTILALRFYQEAKRGGAPTRECDIGDIMRPGHPKQVEALAYCKDAEIHWRINNTNAMNQREWFTHVGSAIRVIEDIVKDALYMSRCSRPPIMDWPAFFRGNGRYGGTHVIHKGNCARKSYAAFGGADFLMKNRDWMSGKCEGIEHYYNHDEPNHYGTFGDFESEALSTSSYRSFFQRILDQTYKFPTEEIQEAVASDCVKLVFRQRSGKLAETFAKDMMANLDPNKVLQTFERTISLGPREIERVTKGESVSKKGGKTKTTQKGTAYINEVERIKEHQLQALSEQNLQNGSFLMNPDYMRLGDVMVIGGNQKPYKIHVDLLPNPFVWQELADAKFRECLSLIYQRKEYQTPLWQESTTISSPPKETNRSTGTSPTSKSQPQKSSPNSKSSQMKRKPGGGLNGSRKGKK